MKIHLIGIGGIGVSALAQYYLSKGHQVSGSDLVASEITDFLKKKKIGIKIGNFAKNIEKDVELVVCSPAVKKNNPELKRAKQLKIKIQTYPEALEELTKQYFTIAVAGAHGKSTTTTLIGLILAAAGLDPTVIVGTKVKEFGDGKTGSNFRVGKSNILVVEACEYENSFLNYFPKIIAVTNVDKEHLDHFKTFSNVIKAFSNFFLKLPLGGSLIYNSDDKNIPLLENSNYKKIGYSLDSKEAGKIKKIIKVPGDHNVSNALAALLVARTLLVPDEISFKAISKFKGTWRRFELKQTKISGKRVTVVSDYAHHPNEIAATLIAAREKFKNKIIWCVFQPHQRQRTHYLFVDFVKTFWRLPIDRIIITDIYDVAGREILAKSGGVSSKKLVEKINKESVIYCKGEDLKKLIEENVGKFDVLIIMGAGDIYQLVDKF